MQSDKTLLYVQIIFAVTVVGNCYLFKPKPLIWVSGRSWFSNVWKKKKTESILSFYLEEEISNAQACISLPLWIDYVHNENYSTFVTQCWDNLCNRIRYWADNGRTATEEIKCLLMRALTADPLSIRVMNFEVFLEDFFHCNFPLKGQAIVLTYREKYRTALALASDGRNKAFETLN